MFILWDGGTLMQFSQQIHSGIFNYAICASYESLSLHVFVYFIVFVGLVFAIEFVYLSGLASDKL